MKNLLVTIPEKYEMAWAAEMDGLHEKIVKCHRFGSQLHTHEILREGPKMEKIYAKWASYLIPSLENFHASMSSLSMSS